MRRKIKASKLLRSRGLWNALDLFGLKRLSLSVSQGWQSSALHSLNSQCCASALQDSRFFGLSAGFDSFSNAGKDLIIQYQDPRNPITIRIQTLPNVSLSFSIH